MSTNSAHRLVDGADHEGLIADQEHAATTTQAILDVAASSAAEKRSPSKPFPEAKPPWQRGGPLTLASD